MKKRHRSEGRPVLWNNYHVSLHRNGVGEGMNVV